MKISVIGTGYVGLVAGACFADTGNRVVCLDIDKKKIDQLRQGQIPIFEPGLETLVKRGVAESRLHFSTSYVETLKESEVVFMAVGTPPLPNGEPNLRYLENASRELGRALTELNRKDRLIVVNKSTVPIGSHETVQKWISSETQCPVEVISNPEFLKEGSAIDDFLKPDRVVIGTHSEEIFRKMEELYAPFVRQGNPILWMDPVSAELTKYACNAFLATRISFMNELALLCDRVGGDVELVRRGMSSDERIGRHFLYPGVGYGGSCFPKDVQALIATARRVGTPMKVIEATEEANARQKRILSERVKAHFQGDLKGRRIAIWGLAFKPNTDDMREAPSQILIEDLLEAGAKVVAFDPVAHRTAHDIHGDRIEYAPSALDALEGAEALCVVTEWNEFRQVDPMEMLRRMKGRAIFDGRNIYSPKMMKSAGFHYQGVGRRPR
jgi:UDPglucose 6-dehydrogenase